MSRGSVREYGHGKRGMHRSLRSWVLLPRVIDERPREGMRVRIPFLPARVGRSDERDYGMVCYGGRGAYTDGAGGMRCDGWQYAPLRRVNFREVSRLYRWLERDCSCRRRSAKGMRLSWHFKCFAVDWVFGWPPLRYEYSGGGGRGGGDPYRGVLGVLQSKRNCHLEGVSATINIMFAKRRH